MEGVSGVGALLQSISDIIRAEETTLCGSFGTERRKERLVRDINE